MDTMSSKDIMIKKQEQLRKYEQLYRDGFCKAYEIECKDIDVRGFLYLVEKRILNRHNPEGVDYRPIGSMVKLYITPLKASMNLGVCSHNPKNDYEEEFEKFKKLVLGRSKKSNDLESKVK
jgi:hypothetical protein